MGSSVYNYHTLQPVRFAVLTSFNVALLTDHLDVTITFIIVYVKLAKKKKGRCRPSDFYFGLL